MTNYFLSLRRNRIYRSLRLLFALVVLEGKCCDYSDAGFRGGDFEGASKLANPLMHASQSYARLKILDGVRRRAGAKIPDL